MYPSIDREIEGKKQGIYNVHMWLLPYPVPKTWLFISAIFIAAADAISERAVK
jgi:hypothetical protein